jgi:class 3 adenylate cyclase
MAVADSGMPETRYAESSDLSIAYQVFGRGSRDLVYVPGIVSHVELAWEDPHTAAFLRGLAEAFRVIVFDKRGQGMSDRIDGVPSLEERRLATALFTDIVQSTEQLAAMGDQRWREMLDRHDHLAENLVHKFRGRIVKNTGDGILALFDGPTRGLYCAQHVLQELGGIGLGVRAGLHIGEIVERNEDITGLAVNIAARVMGEAKLGEVLVTKALMDLTGGSDITFDPAGTHNLRGVPGTFDLFRPLVP